MKILLVYPKSAYGIGIGKQKKRWAASFFWSPSITLPHIAAITPKHHLVEILDESYDDVEYDCDADLVALPCLTETALRVYELADHFRENHKLVVIGGYHASALPEEAKQHADAVVIGEAELCWPQLLSDAAHGKLQPFYSSSEKIDMSTIPPLQRDLLKHHTLFGAVQSTRGCVNRCEFCAIASMYHHGIQHRPVEDVIGEIIEMPHEFFVFNDPSMTTNPKYSRELFHLLIKKRVNKQWIGSGNADMLARLDDEFLELARKSGCIQWNVGFESVSQSSLNGVRKTCNNVNQFKSIVKRLHEYGFIVQSGIMFGFDEDTPEVFELTSEKLYEFDIDIAQINILTPFPGTPIFDRFEQEQRILTRDWSKYNLTTVVFKPKQMTEQELLEGAQQVARRFYSLSNTIIRASKIMMTSKKIAGLVCVSSNFSHRAFYARDYAF